MKNIVNILKTFFVSQCIRTVCVMIFILKSDIEIPILNNSTFLKFDGKQNFVGKQDIKICRTIFLCRSLIFQKVM